MFYVYNVHEWLSEVVTACNENHLDPEQSVFCLVLFSSLDDDCVRFFRDHKNQISSYSGQNVHIFTPIIYEDVIPDDEWRLLRENLNQSGIEVDSYPSLVFFRLRRDGRRFEPYFFGAHRIPDAARLTHLVRDVVDACLRYRSAESRLMAELARITCSPNLIRRPGRSHSQLAGDLEAMLDQPRLFLSHDSHDKPFVRRVSHALSHHYKHSMNPWLDEHELHAGALLRDEIERGLRESDVLLLFLSEHTAGSHWAQHEAAFFTGTGADQRVIPIVIDDAGKELAARLPSTQGRLYLDFREESNWDDNIEKIIEAARDHYRNA